MTKTTKQTRASKYEAHCAEIAQLIIDQLEKGCAPWQKAWDNVTVLPTNLQTGKEYTGGNTLTLLLLGALSGYESPYWLTYKQAKELGGNVKKGERGVHCVYWAEDQSLKINAEKDELTLQTRLIPCLFTVFNAEQIEGVELPKQDKKRAFKPVKAAEKILKNSGAEINEVDSNSAFYNPAKDLIVLPRRSQFKSASGFYDTALHELGHWTGHESRLNRDLSVQFGSESYAREELRAEIASMMIAMEIGLPHNTENHSAYVGSWIKALKEDPKEIFRAAADAEKIKNYIISFNK